MLVVGVWGFMILLITGISQRQTKENTHTICYLLELEYYVDTGSNEYFIDNCLWK